MAMKAPFWWKNRGIACWPWLPLSALFWLISATRRALYKMGWLTTHKLPVPVIIVGNVAAGGSGKTPVVIALVEKLREHGFTPAIVSRGYGGRAKVPTAVTTQSHPSEVGDEPVLLVQRTAAPMWIGADRVAAAQSLLAANPNVDVIITDDGLQHYRLAREVEIVVLDPVILGNALLMPAGPLREPLARTRHATLALAHGQLSAQLASLLSGYVPLFSMQLQAGRWYRLGQNTDQRTPEQLKAIKTRALAGIGRPERFFETLRAQGIEPIQTQAFADHHPFEETDLALGQADALLMTEKDAIKCASIAPKETWVLPVSAQIDEAALRLILERLHGSKTA